MKLALRGYNTSRQIGFAYLIAIGASLACVQASCMVDDRCYSDDDCNFPEICGPGGVCQYQCRVDEDCVDAFSESHVCIENRCEFPPACTLCTFPHAESSCIHGECAMQACDEGFVDADGQQDNGCEYQCTPSADPVERCDGVDNDCNGRIDDVADGDCAYDCTPTGDEVCDSIDNDCDGYVDEDGVCGTSCPADMVAVGHAFCIDRYEASRPDATATSQGVQTSVAMSRPGVLPWMVRPMSAADFTQFQAACAAAGKHLCTKNEWVAACSGPEQNPYVYGVTYDRETCNCVDTFCDDYCEQNAIASCSTSANCGYTYNCFHEVPTGELTGCTNMYGTFDINGNVWEIVPSDSDSRGFEVRGGAFNCAGAAERVSCSFNATWSDLYAGFRCCKPVE
jgi:hypothetical protein